VPLVAIVRHGQASFGTADYDALSAVGEEQSGLVGAELRRRGLREPEVVAGTLRRQRHTASLLMAAARYPGPCGTDKRWDEFDHLALLERYVDPARVEPTLQDSRAFQRLLDEALEAWTRDGGWAAFTADALAALQDVAEALPKGRDAVVVSSGGVIGALAAGLLGAPAATGIALNRVAVNGAITLVAVGGRGAHLLTFNDHAHFTGPRRELLTYR
jgi:broad specificity phosphatase PhoE